MERELLLRIEDLTVEFQTIDGTSKAVNGLSYDILGIVGESGSGKSVSSLQIMQLQIMQLVANTPGTKVSGSITYKGKSILDATEKEMQNIRGNEISMIFQEPMTSLNPIITCGKQIAESLRIHK